MNLSVVIATLYEPVTLDLLVEKAKWSGCEVHVINGMLTNDAWRRGIEVSSNNFVAILNDDIEVCDGFFESLFEPSKYGYTESVALKVPYFCDVGDVRIRYGGTIEPRPVHGGKFVECDPMHKGHAFMIKRDVCKPIPEEFRIYYGDDWYFWQNAYRGSACLVPAAQFKTGKDVFPGTKQESGLSVSDERTESFFIEQTGHTHMEITRSEHEAAGRYFLFVPISSSTTLSSLDIDSAFRGRPCGLTDYAKEMTVECN